MKKLVYGLAFLLASCSNEYMGHMEESYSNYMSSIKNIEVPQTNYSFSQFRSNIVSYPSFKIFPIKDSVPKTLREIKTNLEYIIAIDKSRQLMEIYINENDKDEGWIFEKEYPISTGKVKGNKRKRGDNKTPEGNFTIKDIEYSGNWRYNGRKAYGPYFIRLNTGWSGIGIHGTDEPYKLGKRASHGCIRTANRNIVEIKNKYTNSLVIIRDSFDYYSRSPSIISKIYPKKIPTIRNNAPEILEKKIKFQEEAIVFRKKWRIFGRRRNKH